MLTFGLCPDLLPSPLLLAGARAPEEGLLKSTCNVWRLPPGGSIPPPEPLKEVGLEVGLGVGVEVGGQDGDNELRHRQAVPIHKRDRLD